MLGGCYQLSCIGMVIMLVIVIMLGMVIIYHADEFY